MCGFAASVAPDTENWRRGGGLREINVCWPCERIYFCFSVRFMGRNGKFAIQSVQLCIITARKISNRKQSVRGVHIVYYNIGTKGLMRRARSCTAITV